MNFINIGPVQIGNHLPFTLIAGPCVIESSDHALMIAEYLSKLCIRLGVGFIYKASFDKANRLSVKSYRGMGWESCLPIFQKIKERYKCPVMTDVHSPEHCHEVAAVVDVLQIPAFLCRQTDLLLAAALTGKTVNIKKGQFLAPWDMINLVKKMESFGNEQIMLCERGVSFGYNTLISDMRSLPILAQMGKPVIFDATHSVQQPGGAGQTTGGQREFAPILARAAVAVGVAGIFMETHDNPDKAPSDGPNMIYLHEMEQVLTELIALDKVSKAHPRNLI